MPILSLLSQNRFNKKQIYLSLCMYMYTCTKVCVCVYLHKVLLTDIERWYVEKN